jgi:hypothetical protein
MPSVWSLSSVNDGFRIRLFGPGGRDRVVFEAEEDMPGTRRADLAIWATRNGRLVVRMPGTTERPAIFVDPETGAGRAVPPLPFDVRGSSTNARFHADGGERGELTFLETTFLTTGEQAVVWRLPVVGAAWEPVGCPARFAARDIAMQGDRLWVGGSRPAPGRSHGVPAIVELSPSGEVLDDLPIGTAGWKKRYGPVTGSFSRLQVGPGGTPIVGVNPRLFGPEDDKVYVWIHGQWTRFDEWLTAIDMGPPDVTLFFRDGLLRTWAEGRWSKKVRVPIDKPLQGVARRGSAIAVADSRRISLSSDGGRTYSTVAEADAGEDFRGVAFGPGRPFSC